MISSFLKVLGTPSNQAFVGSFTLEARGKCGPIYLVKILDIILHATFLDWVLDIQLVAHKQTTHALCLQPRTLIPSASRL